eukprot:scaffold9589_cov139-Skeletonema_dohrnii-CCMP3373.AAC.4
MERATHHPFRIKHQRQTRRCVKGVEVDASFALSFAGVAMRGSCLVGIVMLIYSTVTGDCYFSVLSFKEVLGPRDLFDGKVLISLFSAERFSSQSGTRDSRLDQVAPKVWKAHQSSITSFMR